VTAKKTAFEATLAMMLEVRIKLNAKYAPPMKRFQSDTKSA
jgi:hypothetical protein